MSTPPPSFAQPAQPVPVPADPASTALAWLSGHAIFQSLTAGAFGGLIAGWIACSAAMVAAFTAACAMCLVVPILGWFIGLPIVVFAGMMVAVCWLGALGVLLCAWAFTALFGLLVGLVAQVAASRR
jgi:hypothetical protein